MERLIFEAATVAAMCRLLQRYGESDRLVNARLQEANNTSGSAQSMRTEEQDRGLRILVVGREREKNVSVT